MAVNDDASSKSIVGDIGLVEGVSGNNDALYEGRILDGVVLKTCKTQVEYHGREVYLGGRLFTRPPLKDTGDNGCQGKQNTEGDDGVDGGYW